VLASVDDHLVRFGQEDPSEGAQLPADFDGDLVPVLRTDGTSVLLGVHRGLLFRVTSAPGSRPQAIGRARSVVAPSGVPGRALVWRADGVAEVEVATGRVSQPAPFPGFDPAGGWRPEGVVSALGVRTMLVSRVGQGEVELALAWPARRVDAGVNAPLQPLGSFRGLVGIAGDWVLVASDECPGPGCRVRIVSVTRDAVLTRDVGPPAGWTFSLGVDSAESLVLVRREGTEAARLARLVAGGDNALLVRGTARVDTGAGLVGDALDGSVLLVTTTADGTEQVRQWHPAASARAVPVGPAGDLPASARLVCACG
jgi:hypothetical protein